MSHKDCGSFSLFLRYTGVHVPHPDTWPLSICNPLQAVLREDPGTRRDPAGIVDYGHMPAAWRSTGVPTVRGVPGSALVEAVAEAGWPGDQISGGLNVGGHEAPGLAEARAFPAHCCVSAEAGAIREGQEGLTGATVPKCRDAGASPRERTPQA
jgi:hypothetical protein